MVHSSLDAVTKSLLQLKSDIRNANVGGMLQLTKGLREFFRVRITLEQAGEEIRRALDSREERFLSLLHDEVYGRPASPYQKLFKMVGCEFSDLRAHVRQHGLEKSLEKLAAEGAYLTSDEFKGKREVVRRGVTFRVSPKDFDRSASLPGFAIQSSGTRNRPVASFIPLDWLAVRAWAMRVFLSAHDLWNLSYALFDAILPGSAVNHLLINARMGRRTERWFARRIPSNTRLAGIYHKSTTALIVFTAKCSRVGLPSPEFLDTRNLRPILRWVEQNRREGRNCQITTIVSSAVRIARAALEMGISLNGTKFVISGEPYTESKRHVIEQTGAKAITHYAYGGGMNAGFECGNAISTDDIHVNQHMLALISQPKPLNDGLAIRPLLCSTLHPAAPRLLINVENGDYATLKTRNCGCALGKAGLNLHIDSIRSFEKFTSEGMNYFYGDLFDLLERQIPNEFGGGPGDYQLVEEEDGLGQTRLSLLVHPDVPRVDEERLLLRLQQGLEQNPNGSRFMVKVWKDAGTLRIRREAPYASPRGKILPLQIRH